MFGYRIRLAAVAWSFAISGLTHAEGVSWEELTRRAERLSAERNFAEAEATLRRALKEAENFGRQDLRRARTWLDLGRTYYRMGRLPDAETMYERSLSAWEESVGKRHPSLAEPLSCLVALYLEHGLAGRAERLLNRLEFPVQTLDATDPATLMLLPSFAALYHAQRRYGKAELLYRHLLQSAEKTFGLEDQRVVRLLNNLGLLYAHTGRHQEAIPYLERALSISERALGSDHPDVARSLTNLAALYSAIGRHKNAEPLFQRALAIAENSLGAESRLAGQIVAEYAVLMRETGRKNEAKALESRAQAIRQLNAAGDLGRHTIHIGDLTTRGQND